MKSYFGGDSMQDKDKTKKQIIDELVFSRKLIAKLENSKAEVPSIRPNPAWQMDEK